MVHGMQDWGFGKQAVVHMLSEDLAELAARLGSIHVYERRGYVLWSDDFRKGAAAWWSDTDGDGAEIEIDSTNPKWAPYALKLVGGSDGDRSAQIAKKIGPVVLGGYGFELSVDFLTDFFDCRLELKLDCSVGFYQPSIRLSSDTDKIHYLAGTGFWVELDDLPTLKHTFSGYHNLKLVVDYKTGYYKRFLLDDVVYDLSDYPLYVTPTYGNYYLRPYFYFRSRANENDYCFVDGAIVTQNE